MKVSEVTPADLAEFLRLDECQEDEMQRILDSAKGYIRDYTGLTDEEIDTHADFPTALGFVGKSKGSDNKVVHKAIIYLKAQFKEATDEYSTKQENITFSHSTMEGNLYYLENGDWKDEKTFDTLEEAKAYVDTTLGKTAVAA